MPEGYIELGELCRVHRGSVTGANAIWITRADDPALPRRTLFPSITKARELFDTADGVLLNLGDLRAVIDLPEDLKELGDEERELVERFLTENQRFSHSRTHVRGRADEVRTFGDGTHSGPESCPSRRDSCVSLASPPRWTSEQFEEQREQARQVFRDQRLNESQSAYVETYLECLKHINRLLAETDNLTLLEPGTDQSSADPALVGALTDPDLLESLRYIVGPPVSADDLIELSDTSLAPGVLSKNPTASSRVIETIAKGIDPKRFPWVAQRRTNTSPYSGPTILSPWCALSGLLHGRPRAF